MTKKSKLPIEALRKHVLPLAKNCPADKCRPADCPLSTISKQSPAQRAEAINALSEADLAYLAAYCHVCTDIMLSAPLTAPGKKSRA